MVAPKAIGAARDIPRLGIALGDDNMAEHARSGISAALLPCAFQAARYASVIALTPASGQASRCCP